MGNAIPQGQRALVKVRDNWRCVRCGMPGTEWHHRRSRSIKDEHVHCTCVGILLCSTCHRWVHAHPLAARASGWIVSRYEEEPWTVPFKAMLRGWVLPNCEGDVLSTDANDLGEAIENLCVKATTTNEGEGGN